MDAPTITGEVVAYETCVCGAVFTAGGSRYEIPGMVLKWRDAHAPCRHAALDRAALKDRKPLVTDNGNCDLAPTPNHA